MTPFTIVFIGALVGLGAAVAKPMGLPREDAGAWLVAAALGVFGALVAALAAGAADLGTWVSPGAAFVGAALATTARRLLLA